MGVAEPVRHITVAEYLAAERLSETKHEFLGGEVFAMAGGSPVHALIATNLTGELRTRLKDKSCRSYNSALRIRVEDADLHAYPDASIICGELQFADADRDTVTNPTMLVEVLSPSTEAHDRGEKFSQYRRIPSLQAYLLTDQFRPRLELLVRTRDGFWQLSTAEGLDATLEIPPLGITLPLAEVYRDVKFELIPPRVRERRP